MEDKTLKEYGRNHFQNYLLIHKLEKKFYDRGLRKFENEILFNAKNQNLLIQKRTGLNWKQLNNIGREQNGKV